MTLAATMARRATRFSTWFRPTSLRWQLSTLFPRVIPWLRKKNPNATAFFQRLRKVTRVTGTTFVAVHHLKKPSPNPRDATPPLEDAAKVLDWLQQARGASALINASDVRLGMDLP